MTGRRGFLAGLLVAPWAWRGCVARKVADAADYVAPPVDWRAASLYGVLVDGEIVYLSAEDLSKDLVDLGVVANGGEIAVTWSER